MRKKIRPKKSLMVLPRSPSIVGFFFAKRLVFVWKTLPCVFFPDGYCSSFSRKNLCKKTHFFLQRRLEIVSYTKTKKAFFMNNDSNQHENKFVVNKW